MFPPYGTYTRSSSEYLLSASFISSPLHSLYRPGFPLFSPNRGKEDQVEMLERMLMEPRRFAPPGRASSQPLRRWHIADEVVRLREGGVGHNTHPTAANTEGCDFVLSPAPEYPPIKSVASMKEQVLEAAVDAYSHYPFPFALPSLLTTTHNTSDVRISNPSQQTVWQRCSMSIPGCVQTTRPLTNSWGRWLRRWWLATPGGQRTRRGSGCRRVCTTQPCLVCWLG